MSRNKHSRSTAACGSIAYFQHSLIPLLHVPSMASPVLLRVAPSPKPSPTSFRRQAWASWRHLLCRSGAYGIFAGGCARDGCKGIAEQPKKSLRRFGSFLPSLPPLSVSLGLPLGVVWLRAQARGSFAELVALTGQSQHLPALVRAGVASQGVPASALSSRGGPGPGRFATRTFHYSVAAAVEAVGPANLNRFLASGEVDQPWRVAHSADVFVFSWFMLREIEVAGARVGDITVARCVVCLDLPLRKVRATMRHPARTCP